MEKASQLFIIIIILLMFNQFATTGHLIVDDSVVTSFMTSSIVGEGLEQSLKDRKNIIKSVSNELSQSQCACCSEPYTEFDFWKGNWSVKDTSGNKVGDNTITKVESNCILKEKWVGSKGGTGTSINFYDKADSTWNQTWVDNNGDVLRLKGGLVNETMVLKSNIIKGKKMNYYNQIAWTPNQDGTVTQLWELYDVNKNLLHTLFKGIYHPKETE